VVVVSDDQLGLLEEDGPLCRCGRLADGLLDGVPTCGRCARLADRLFELAVGLEADPNADLIGYVVGEMTVTETAPWNPAYVLVAGGDPVRLSCRAAALVRARKTADK
jgi:uncharacterized protein (DUF983 family)